MKYLLITLAFIWGANVLAQEYITEDELTDKYIAVIQKKIPELSVKKTSNLDVEFKTKSGIEQNTNLYNAYLEYKASPSDLSSILDRYSNSFVEAMSQISESQLSNSIDKNRIFPVIKDQSYISQISTMMKEKYGRDEMPFIHTKINEVLYLVFALDSENSIRFLTKEDATKLELENSDLLTLSLKNLKREFAGVNLKGDPASLSMLVVDGNYEASFFLADSLWSKKTFPVKGDIVVHIPARDTVLITGSDDSQGLETVAGIMSQNFDKWDHPITNVGFIRTNETWNIYKSK
ncbi:DUF1444 family protein [Shewanella baltica]|uniref:DUF1444 family protein n=1 Tax=Shewanella baltica TaxID=62322 RepID=UPI003D05D6D1